MNQQKHLEAQIQILDSKIKTFEKEKEEMENQIFVQDNEIKNLEETIEKQTK